MYCVKLCVTLRMVNTSTNVFVRYSVSKVSGAMAAAFFFCFGREEIYDVKEFSGTEQTL